MDLFRNICLQQIQSVLQFGSVLSGSQRWHGPAETARPLLNWHKSACVTRTRNSRRSSLLCYSQWSDRCHVMSYLCSLQTSHVLPWAFPQQNTWVYLSKTAWVCISWHIQTLPLHFANLPESARGRAGICHNTTRQVVGFCCCLFVCISFCESKWWPVGMAGCMYHYHPVPATVCRVMFLFLLNIMNPFTCLL